MKQFLFEYLNNYLTPLRQKYNELLETPEYVEEVLLKGQQKARERSIPFLRDLREAIGISPIT